MFIAALFTAAKTLKQIRCTTTDEWIKKSWYLHAIKLCLAIKKNEFLSFASKWMELENIILTEINLVQKMKYFILLSYVECRPSRNTSNIIYAYKYVQNRCPKLTKIGGYRE
jgi:hypothetical protein